MRFVAGLVVGVMVSVGGVGLYAQNERMMHPRINKAIISLQDAVEYMKAAPHDFGGHKADAIHASEEALHQLHMAMEYRGERDRH
jgi:hypothetical protein